VIVADHRKDSKVLGTNWLKGVPLEVIPEGHVTVANAITKMGGKPTLRMGVAKAGPVITDNGTFMPLHCTALRSAGLPRMLTGRSCRQLCD